MSEERKAILLRIPPGLWDQVNRLAQRELRSINAQIEFMLRESIAARAGPNEVRAGRARGKDRAGG